jgi:rhamnose utilization protein RhaD (predicted bifunctional aldolase and dehydrogenase)
MVLDHRSRVALMSSSSPSFESEFTALRELSAHIGSNPLLIQGAGGNTSIKHDGLLWIKASGKWLANAHNEDMFVPVRLDPVLYAVASGSADAEKAELFTNQSRNPSGLRPSIETTVHALMPQKVVVHVHCVETIALAVRVDAEMSAARRLEGFSHAFIPYARPGLPLAMAIAERLRPGTNVLVLANHGLVVAAETVADAAALLEAVCSSRAVECRTPPPADTEELEMLRAGSTYRLPCDPSAHGVATDSISLHIASGGSLYPDHVVFLGQGSFIAKPGDTAASIESVAGAAGLPSPVSILFPNIGVLMRGDASPGADAMAGCLADVTVRLDDNAQIRYLTEAEHGELLNWDAEKYRQQLDKTREAAG